MTNTNQHTRRTFLRATVAAGTGALTRSALASPSPTATAEWALGPFVKHQEPVLRPTPDPVFTCPIDPNDRKTVLKEHKEPFLWPEYEWEKKGFVGNTTVANGLVPFKGEWMLYYGAADRVIGLAVCETM